MAWRTVVVTSRAKLELKNNYLVIRSDSIKRVYLDEISVLLIENTGSAVTVSLLEALWRRKIAVIFCDQKRNPGAQIIPYYNSYDCSCSVYSQIKWDKDFSSEVWSEVVRQKILNQAYVLGKFSKHEAQETLLNYALQIEKGDSSNREGHAAKVYFNALYGSSFSRKDSCPENALLNYGYGVLLSAVSREIVSNGYLTQIGIFHSNVYNPFNLSCDLMEPYRPVFDLFVYPLTKSELNEIDHEKKVIIIDILNKTVRISETYYTLLSSLSFYVRSVLDSLDKKDLSLLRFIDEF